MREKICHVNTNPKNSRVTILLIRQNRTQDKIITKDKKKHFFMIEEPISMRTK